MRHLSLRHFSSYQFSSTWHSTSHDGSLSLHEQYLRYEAPSDVSLHFLQVNFYSLVSLSILLALLATHPNLEQKFSATFLGHHPHRKAPLSSVLALPSVTSISQFHSLIRRLTLLGSLYITTTFQSAATTQMWLTLFPSCTLASAEQSLLRSTCYNNMHLHSFRPPKSKVVVK